jgi:hypothetical protein
MHPGTKIKHLFLCFNVKNGMKSSHLVFRKTSKLKNLSKVGNSIILELTGLDKLQGNTMKNILS